ncbi:hypothetical protein BT69DRAFT_113756 [Atractiella rhizophila]|nr:hypothetical protein BT69DRAFT_113756 [Atractiella rhizophila]
MYGCEGTGGWGRFLRGFAEDVERGGAGFAAFGNRLLEVDEEEVGTSGSEDGIGDLGYLENGLEGVQDDSDASDGLYFDDDGYINGKKANGVVSKKKDSAVFGGGNFRGPVKARHPSKWRLRKEWKKWTADHEGEGGVVGALAERSRRLWRDREGLLGRLELQKRERALYTQSRNDENSKGKDKEDNFDTATLSPRST